MSRDAENTNTLHTHTQYTIMNRRKTYIHSHTSKRKNKRSLPLSLLHTHIIMCTDFGALFILFIYDYTNALFYFYRIYRICSWHHHRKHVLFRQQFQYRGCSGRWFRRALCSSRSVVGYFIAGRYTTHHFPSSGRLGLCDLKITTTLRFNRRNCHFYLCVSTRKNTHYTF